VRRTLEYAVDFLHIEKDIPFHRAFSDAYYTAKVFNHIKNKNILTYFSYDTFVKPTSRKEEIHVVFDTYAKYISRLFPDKISAMEDREVISCKCYLCHKNVKRKIKWFSPNGKHYYAVSLCDKHGYLKGKIRIRKAEQEQVYVVKTEKFITAEDVLKIKAMLLHAKEQKRTKKQKQRKTKFLPF
jgi:CxxC motif-containing protein